jgi:hypothetical protein
VPKPWLRFAVIISRAHLAPSEFCVRLALIRYTVVGMNESVTNRSTRRWDAVVQGATIGLLVAVVWTAFVGPLTDGPPSIALSFIVYAIGFTVTGALIGARQQRPELTGLEAGLAILFILALIVGPKDGWIVIWVSIFGLSGVICGPTIGMIFRLFRRGAYASSDQANRREPCPAAGKVSTGAMEAQRLTAIKWPGDQNSSGGVLGALGVVLSFCAFFAAGGGTVALGLNWMAPGYYRAVFPWANEAGYATEAGVGTGVLQGLLLGFLVGAVVAIGLGYFGRLPVDSYLRAFATVLLCGVGFAVVGTAVGCALGIFLPGYYRGMLIGGRHPDFDPVDVGIGLGCSQGLILGVLVGAAAVIASIWHRSPQSTGAGRSAAF